MLNIHISEKDVEETLSEKALTAAKGRVVLGESTAESTRRVVMEALPKILARRIECILPKDFVIKEIEMRISVEGKPFGVGMGGDAIVKFGPKDSIGHTTHEPGKNENTLTTVASFAPSSNP